MEAVVLNPQKMFILNLIKCQSGLGADSLCQQWNEMPDNIVNRGQDEPPLRSGSQESRVTKYLSTSSGREIPAHPGVVRSHYRIIAI
jgi:hypothetical protein